MNRVVYLVYLIFISAAFAIGCSSPHSEASTQGEACSDTTKQAFLEYQKAQAAHDSLLVTSSCARILSVNGSQSCQMQDSAGQPMAVSYRQIEKDCQAAALLVEQAKASQALPLITDPKLYCSEEVVHRYRGAISKITRLQNASSESRNSEYFEFAIQACERSKNSLQGVLKCSAEIAGKRRWISWEDLAPMCHQADLDYQTFLSQWPRLSKPSGRWSHAEARDSILSDGGLIMQVPLKSLSQKLQLTVLSGLDMTSIFAFSSEQIEIFYLQGAIVGRRVAEKAALSGQVACGLTREEINLTLAPEDVYLSQKFTVKEHEKENDLRRSILRFESSSNSLFWVSCISESEHNLSGQDIQTAFGDLLEIKILIKNAEPSSGEYR